MLLTQLESTQGYAVRFHVASQQVPLGGVLGRLGLVPQVDKSGHHLPPLNEALIGLHVPRSLRWDFSHK